MPKVVDHDARRDAIALACFGLFARRGYAASTIKDMATAAGCSTGTLYYYFPEKAAVLDHMFRLLAARDVADARQAIASAGSTPEERVRSVGSFLHHRRGHLRSVIQVAMEVHRHEPSETARVEVMEALRTYRAVLGEALGLRDGLLLRQVFALVVGMLVQAILDGDARDLSEDLQRLLPLWSAVAALEPALR
jgi:AcrR family transcriptional regulator